MKYALILDASGNPAGSHAYADDGAAVAPGEVPCTAAQAQSPADWIVQNGIVLPSPNAGWAAHQAAAHAALAETEKAALRFFMAGQSFPPTWQAHAQSLRAITSAASGTPAPLPAAPTLPAGV